MASEELQRVWDSAWMGSEGRSWIRGRMGRKETDGTIVVKTGRANFVHVSLGAEGENGYAIAYNKGVALKPFLPIRMRLDETKGYLVVHDVDIGAVFDAFTGGSDGTGYNVGPHTHAIDSGMEYRLEPLRMAQGLVQGTTGLLASCTQPFRYYHDGAWDTYDSAATIDLTSYLPASGWCWILVGLDPATNTLVAAKGADQTLQADLTASLIDSVSFAGYIPLCAVQAADTDTSLTNVRRWQDARNWLNHPVRTVEEIKDVVLTSLTDRNILIWEAGSSTWVNGPGTPATVDVPKSFEVYTDVKERLSEENIHGGIDSLATAQPLDSVPTDLPVTVGVGKILVVINTGGGDYDGSILVTGTSVDRDTQVETPADTDTLIVDAITTDGSGTDGNGNITHAFTGAYITGKWFKGAVVLSTADLTLTDVDVYQVSFEQFGDTSGITLDALDFSATATNASAWMNAHLYSLATTTGDKCDIVLEASLELLAADVSANKWYRRREGGIATALDGSTDGIWVDQFLGPLANVYWEDINLKVWYTHNITIVGNFAAPLVGVDYIQFDTTYADGVEEGRLQWNIEDGTLEVGMPGGQVNLQIGQEMNIRCRNTTGSTITNGSVVEIIGASGNRPLISPADASDLTKISVLGMATEDILNNDNGYVATKGFVRDVNTTGMTIGEPVYLSPSTPGAYTQTRPTAPDFIFPVGLVIAAHASEGVVYTGPIPVWRMMDLSDVLFDATPADGEYLAYSIANGRFELTAAPSGGATSHGALTDLLVDDHSQYLLLAGRAGGQAANGGTASGDDLTLDSTAHATKGSLILQPSGGDVGIGTAAPATNVHIHETGSGDVRLQITNDTTGAASTDGAMIGLNASEQFEIWQFEAQPMLLATSNQTRLIIEAGGDVGIGVLNPDGKLHVHTATAGAVTAAVSADDLVVENSANAGISILTPNTSLGSIFFGDPEDNDEGGIQFDHNSNNLALFTGLGNLYIATTGPYTFNDSFRIDAAQSPASGGAGLRGEIAWDSTYIYVCISLNTWGRALLQTGY